MSLQADQAVEHLHAGIFQVARPANVSVFIETCLQLYDRGHFFLLGGGYQRRNDQRMLVGAIERLLDGEHASDLRPRIR